MLMIKNMIKYQKVKRGKVRVLCNKLNKQLNWLARLKLNRDFSKNLQCGLKHCRTGHV